MKTVKTYHVHYKLKGFDEWWDWKSFFSAQEAIADFTSNAERYNNTEEAVLIKTVTQISQYVDCEISLPNHR